MNAREEIGNQVRDLLDYFPGRGRLRILWLLVLPILSTLFYSRFPWGHNQSLTNGIPWYIFMAAGNSIYWLYYPAVLVLLLRINHSDRPSWHGTACIIASSVAYGIVVSLPALLVNITWSACYVGISFSSILQTLLGVLMAIGGVLLLATVVGALAHCTRFFIPLILFLLGMYAWFLPIAFSDKMVPQGWRMQWAAVPLVPATVILRNGILNRPFDTTTLNWVAGSIHAILGYVLIFWIWRRISNSASPALAAPPRFA